MSSTMGGGYSCKKENAKVASVVVDRCAAVGVQQECKAFESPFESFESSLSRCFRAFTFAPIPRKFDFTQKLCYNKTIKKMGEYYTMERQYYKVFSEWVANELVNAGFNPIRREMNYKHFGLYVYTFKYSQAFDDKFVEVSTSRKDKR